MRIFVLASSLLFHVLAQHHSDPFAGSGCDCDSFCRYECAINATDGPVERTFYRMTMKGVYDLRDKDTGDVAGDTSFVLSKKNNAYMCRKDPQSFMCKDLAQFSGDDVNSTDLILKMTVTVDGQYGPYLECNPINASDSTGKWSCENGLSRIPTPGYPKQCSQLHYHGDTGYCINASLAAKVFQGETQEQVCEYLAQQPAGKYSAYTYFPKNQTTYLHTHFEYDDVGDCKDSILGFYDPPDPNRCDCERVYKAVGLQNQSSRYHSSYGIAGGLWFSHPAGGECSGDQEPGDSSGCTYKLTGVPRVIKATCMYKQIDAFIESNNEDCFSNCPQPHNVTSDCYLECYSHTLEKVPKSKLTIPWGQAFEADGCPQMPLPPGHKFNQVDQHKPSRLVSVANPTKRTYIMDQLI